MTSLILKFKQEKSSWLKVIIVTMLYFGVGVYLAFATDTYWTFLNGFHNSAVDMAVRNGRPVIGMIYELYSLTGLSNETFYYLSGTLALLFLSASIWIYQKILAKYQLTENIRILISFVSIANIFILEYFMFIEKCGFMLAIFFNAVAILLIDKFFERKEWKYFLGSVMVMILATFTYQGTIALFVILSLPFASKSAKSFKDYLFHVFAIGLSYAIPVLLDLIALKFVFKSSRIKQEVNLFENCKNVIDGLRRFGVSTFSILPSYMFLILLGFGFLAAIFMAIKMKHRFIYLINIPVIILASVIFSAATIIQGTGWWSQRTTYPIASVLGALTVHMFISGRNRNVDKVPKVWLQSFVVGLMGILLIGQYFSFNKIFIDKYRLNTLDEYRARYIEEAIQEYQNDSGTEITQIAFYSDASRTYPAYPHLYSEGDLIVSSFYTEWSDIVAMNYYLNSQYSKVEQTEEYTEYFASKDWSNLSQEQLIFEGNTLHLCIY